MPVAGAPKPEAPEELLGCEGAEPNAVVVVEARAAAPATFPNVRLEILLIKLFSSPSVFRIYHVAAKESSTPCCLQSQIANQKSLHFISNTTTDFDGKLRVI
jgi:hypothetical protein